MSTAIVEVQSAVAEFDRVAAGIALLQQEYAGVVFDVSTTKGLDSAKAARAAVREPRYEIEKVRKAAKEPLLKLGKELDARAKEITAQILAIEEPIDLQIKTEENRKEAEKQAKIAAEQQRVADIQARIVVLRGNQSITSLSDPKLIADHIADLEAIAVDDSFEEFKQQAADAKAAGIARLKELHAAALAHQAEQERIKAERAELARLRAVEEERARVERERIAAEEAMAKALRDEEAAKQAAALAAERAEQNRIAAERQAAQDAEAARLAAERAELERQQEALRKAQEPAPKPKGKAKRPSDADLIGAIASHFSVDKKVAVDWILAIDFSNKELAA